MPKTTPKTARGLGRIFFFLRQSLPRLNTWIALATALVVGCACGTGSISFPGALGQAGGNTPGQPSGSGTGSTPGTVAPPAANAAGLGVGFEYVEGSASATEHPISDTTYWSSALQSLTAQATGSVPTARLIVGTWTGSRVDLQFPQGSGARITNATFRSSDSFSAILSAFDAANANVILEVQPGTASPTALAQAILEQYVNHTSVIGISYDLSQYGRTLGKTQLTDTVANSIVRAAQNYGSKLLVQVRHSDARYFPSSNVDALGFVLDTAGTGSETALKSRAQAFSQAYSPAKVSFIVGAQTDKAWACKLSGPGQLIGDVAAGGTNVAGIFWSTQTVSQLSPTNTFACPAPDPVNNPNTGANPNTPDPTPANPNTPATNPNTPSTNPNTPATNPNTAPTNPNTPANPNTPSDSPNTVVTSPNDTGASDSNTRGGGFFGF